MQFHVSTIQQRMFMQIFRYLAFTQTDLDKFLIIFPTILGFLLLQPAQEPILKL
jgi:hypothetical protein